MKWYTKLRLVLCLIALAVIGVYYCVDLYVVHPFFEQGSLQHVIYVHVWKDEREQDVTKRLDQDALRQLIKQCERRRAFPWEGRREEEVLQHSPVEIGIIPEPGFPWRMFVGPEEIVVLDSRENWHFITGGEALWQSLAPLLE